MKSNDHVVLRVGGQLWMAVTVCILAALIATPVGFAGEKTKLPVQKVNDKNSPIKEKVTLSSEQLNLKWVDAESPEEPAKQAVAAAAEASPAATPEPAAAAPEEASPESEPVASEPLGDYTIGPGDLLSFQSFDDPSITRDQVLVLYDGTVSLPLIPNVNINGMTRDQAEAAIRTAYEKVFKVPQIALNVRTTASKYFYVIGDVNRASKYPYEGKVNVLEAINIAGGLRITQRSGGEAYAATQGTLSKAFIIRTGSSGREIIELDLSGLTRKGPHPSETEVYPGDIVYLPEGVNLVYVLGEVRTPSVFQLNEGQTLTQVLTIAGGPLETSARISHVVLMRPVDATNYDVLLIDWKKILKTGKDIPLQPGDVVYVPRKGLVRLQEFVSRFTGSISPLLSLYTQAYDAYYTDKRYNLLFNNTTDTNQLVTTLQGIRNFGSILGSLPQLPAATP
ncbi:MAG: polysaccharide export protein [Candidatus Hydrogenedentes bacterium]|nr:polysaccharide export protein [Candidatus Hydrogenedentota bacterium]